MFGKIFKGLVVLAIWIFAALGICAALPDSAWKTFPKRLIPIRTCLARHKIISSEYANPNSILNETELADSQKSSSTDPDEVSASNLSVAQTDSLQSDPRSSSNGFPSKRQKKQGSSNDPNDLFTNSNRTPISLKNEMDKKNAPSVPELKLPERHKLPPLGNVAQNDTLPNLQFTPIQTPASPSPGTNPVDSIPGNDVSLIRNQSPAPMPSAPSTSGPMPLAPIASTPIQSTPTVGGIAPLSNGTAVTNSNSIPGNGSQIPVTTSNDSLPVMTPLTPVRSAPIAAELPPTAKNGNIAPTSGLLAAGKGSNESAPLANPVYVQENEKEKIKAKIAQETKPNPLQVYNELVKEYSGLNNMSSNESIQNVFLKMSALLTGSESSLPPNEVRQLQTMLDKLAFQVFYNPQKHILERVYVTSFNETLKSVADRHEIAPEFLGILNGLNINPSQPLPPGTRLKVVRGPVSAIASMNKKELLLLFNGLYAGRFNMGCSVGAKSLRGMLSVTNKVPNPDYKGPTTENLAIQEIPGGAPNNPLGACWIQLNNGLGLQGTNRPEYIGNETARTGGLIFSNKDISHLNILLSKGSVLELKD